MYCTPQSIVASYTIFSQIPQSEDELLAVATFNLRWFAFVGLTERPAESVRMMTRVLRLGDGAADKQVTCMLPCFSKLLSK